MAHIVEIWEMHGDSGKTWTPACLSCGWVGTGTSRLVAEAEAELHGADESARFLIARRPSGDSRRTPDPRWPRRAG